MSHSEVISDTLGNTTNIHEPTTDHQQQIFINDLPDEVLIHTFSQLEPSSLNSLRLVCKKWNHVINDKETWTRLFRKRFGILLSASSFPSVTHGSNWMNEYFARLQIIRNWKRGTSTHQTYQMVNSELRIGGLTLCDFKMNKLAVFDKVLGNISFGNLDSGKNQSFIPGMMSMDILSYDMNFNYLVMGKKNGGIVVKNLIISTSFSQRGSVTNFEIGDDERSPITSVIINAHVDKNGAAVDVISGLLDGNLLCWSLHGKLKTRLVLDGGILNIKSDFNKFVIVNTTTSVYVLKFENLEVLGHANLDIPICDEEVIHVEQLLYFKNSLDVDFGGENIIISRGKSIRVYDFHCTGIRKLDFEDESVVLTQFQTVGKTSLHNVNPNVVGGDGLLCGNLLSDGSIIIWNVREISTHKIEPQLRLFPELNHKKILGRIHNAVLNGQLLGVTTFALNASVVAVAGYNGLTCVYDVFTGKFLREVSIKFPKRFDHMQHFPKMVELVKLNPDQQDTNGVIVCGDVIQYFEFGKMNSKKIGAGSNKKAKQVNIGSHGKHESKKKIKDGMDEYHRQLHVQNKTEQLFDRYNGTEYDDEEEEMRIALAMSENMYSNSSSQTDVEVHVNGGNGDEDLKLALELSKLDNAGGAESGKESKNESQVEAKNKVEEDDEVDEALKRALELSLIEH